MPIFKQYSRKWKRTLVFWMPEGGGYIRLDLTPNNRQPGTLGHQICNGGLFTGNTLSASSDKDFQETCLRWYRAYIRKIDRNFDY